tara:strand:- start:729 stop:977 length:249 start_codon:yes stop_codon:yes gene_type:complete
MTTKKKFDVEEPEVVVLTNGRYAYRVDCPWEGKQGKKLTAFKFCSAENYREYMESKEAAESAELSEGELHETSEKSESPVPS